MVAVIENASAAVGFYERLKHGPVNEALTTFPGRRLSQ